GGDFGVAYRDQAERSRQRLRDAWQYHSGSALAGALAGSLPVAGGVGMLARGGRAAAALRNLTPAQRVLAAGGSGAAWGGAYGLGADNDDRLDTWEGWRNRALGAGFGAALGAATGAAFQGAGMGAAHAWRSAVRPMLDPA